MDFLLYVDSPIRLALIAVGQSTEEAAMAALLNPENFVVAETTRQADLAFRRELARLRKLHLDGALTTEGLRAAADTLLNRGLQVGD